MMIHKLRIVERNAIKLEMREIENYKQMNIASSNRLRRSNSGDKAYILAQIERKKKQNSGFDADIARLTQRLTDLENGKLDEELCESVASSTRDQRQKSLQTRQKKIEQQKDKAEKSVISRAYYERTRRSAREERYEIKNANRGYMYFLKVVNSLPAHIVKNLKNMSCNKGYIWRGIQLFGEKPADSDKTTLFERKHNCMYIHEWSNDLLEHRLYAKEGKEGRKYLKRLDIYEKRERRPRKLVSSTEFEKPPEKSRKQHHSRNRTSTSGQRNNRTRGRRDNRRSCAVAATPEEKRRRTRRPPPATPSSNTTEDNRSTRNGRSARNGRSSRNGRSTRNGQSTRNKKE